MALRLNYGFVFQHTKNNTNTAWKQHRTPPLTGFGRMRKRAADRTHFQIQRTPVLVLHLNLEEHRGLVNNKETTKNEERGRAT
jgi:hypothetical protein